MNKNAVIYPRFSSSGQNEQSIESQIRICREFAEKQGYNVVGIYPEKARTGTNDSRPAFQRMIKDAAGGAFQYIIVYRFDRFARNRRDSIMYKEMLKQDYGTFSSSSSTLGQRRLWRISRRVTVSRRSSSIR